MKIFLSSTFKDLENHRAAVIRHLRQLDGVELRCMEDFGARAGSPRDFCVREASECNLFVGIIGHLYGFIPEGDQTSITEQEYDAADRARKDKLLFVAPEEFPVPMKLVRADADPGRQEAFRKRVLRNDTVSGDWSSPEALATRVVQAVHNWRLREAPGSALASAPVAGIDLVTYAQRCRRRWEVIDLSALAAPGALDAQAEPPRLSQLFIPQACRLSRPAVSLPRDYLEKQGLDPNEEEQLEEARARWQGQKRVPALELLAKPGASKLVLLGDAGAGKSSLTRYILLRLLDPPNHAADLHDDWRRPLADAWPVLVELRDLVAREAEERSTDLISYTAHVGETQGFGFDRSALVAQLRDRPSLIIVDGLDEIFSVTRRRAMVEEIVGLETRFPKARVIVTSRIAGFDAKPFESAGFTIATLDDLDERQIETFAQSWFGLAFPAEPEKAERARRDLLDTLERRPQLAVIAGNPLILTIMAVIARHKRLARSRAQLYRQALEVLCYAWDYRRGLKLPADSPLADLQPDDTLAILRRVAWRMQESNEGLRANAISDADLRSILTGFFEQEWRFPPPRARRAASETVGLLQERSWVLTARGPGLYGFVHRTFLEYLCALELTKRFEAQEITGEALRDDHVMPRADDDSYAEVIRLLCGQLPVRVAGQLIRAICPTPAAAAGAGGRLLLAWQSLGELDPRGLANVPEACAAAFQGLCAWLQGVSGETNFVTVVKLEEAIRLLEPGSWPETGHSPPDVPYPDDPYPRTIFQMINRALAYAIWAPSAAHRSAAVAMAQSADPATRRGAVPILACAAIDDKNAFEIVRSAAATDESDDVRAAAVAELGQYAWGEYTHIALGDETFEVLRARATTDPASRVRQAAVYALSGYAARPETLATLRALVESDDDELVRRAAQDVAILLTDVPTLRVATLLKGVASGRLLGAAAFASRRRE